MLSSVALNCHEFRFSFSVKIVIIVSNITILFNCHCCYHCFGLDQKLPGLCKNTHQKLHKLTKLSKIKSVSRDKGVLTHYVDDIDGRSWGTAVAPLPERSRFQWESSWSCFPRAFKEIHPAFVELSTKVILCHSAFSKNHCAFVDHWKWKETINFYAIVKNTRFTRVNPPPQNNTWYIHCTRSI